MKLSPRYIAQQEAAQQATFDALRRQPFEKAMDLWYEFNRSCRSDDEFFADLKSIGWTWEDFASVLLDGPKTHVIDNGNETIVVNLR